jgi:homoserine kinase type II
MSVYTPVDRAMLAGFLAPYAVGELQDFHGIEAGIENSNYFVTTGDGEYVLTLFESLQAEELPLFLALMDHLAAAGLPVPRALPDKQGRTLQRLAGKPAILVLRLSGRSVEHPGIGHCRAIGAALAQLHLAAADAPMQRSNPRGYAWWKQVATELAPGLTPQERELLDEELRFQSLYHLQDLPRGMIHADLFRDNVLFQDETVSGMLDLYAACEAPWLYDLAVVVSDWCTPSDGLPDPQQTRALLAAYNDVRPLIPLERGAWPVVLRQAALRFWLSRLWEQHQGRPLRKDPAEFRHRLELFVKNEAYLRNLWPVHKN